MGSKYIYILHHSTLIRLKEKKTKQKKFPIRTFFLIFPLLSSSCSNIISNTKQAMNKTQNPTN